MSHYDIAIAYRIYPKVAKPAVGLPYSEDKLRLAELCLHSFKKALGNLRAKVWVLLDGCPDSYADLFKRYFDERDLRLISLPSVGNQATFGKQIDILLEQNDSDVVYFAEDDYVYMPNQFSLMLDFLLAYTDVDFVSPYDHLDCYTRRIHQHPKWVRVHASHHWRTAASTCLTFLTRQRTLLRKRAVFRSYCSHNHDCSLWLSLTKNSIFDPIQFCSLVLREPLFAKIVVKAWFYGWPHIFFGGRTKLWVPMPALATHLDIQALSPSIDWVEWMTTLGGHVADIESSSIEGDGQPTLTRITGS
jgi:hypothetical protein